MRLIPSEVHVWRACLDPPAAGSQDFTPLLSREEQERAEAFLLPRDRLRFRAGRGLLRILLGRYLKIGPQELEFSYGPHGKPEIGASLKRRKIEFNLSHAGGHLLVAVALGRRVGVDIERISSEPERVEIADRFFAPVERAALEALPETDRPRAFAAYWTCKEAFTKATGEGLACPLDSFAIQLTPGGPSALLYAREMPDAVRRWKFVETGAFTGYADAVVAEGQNWVLRCWEGSLEEDA
ncbi:MAG TPA: 4'-phosphopantetheinyl transferase superfamily protein [Chthonomonadaceae bacterium]|nr:4'-phosphopantetheinyl transferase superfamily protein [Chthonomonadaceae bacterium]